ncbi:hypothetical protein LINPERPRIM_LOCUS23627 [Linum perenne]
MASDKAPSPDGFSAQFNKHTWATSGGDIFHAFNYFWSGGDLPEVRMVRLSSLRFRIPVRFRAVAGLEL